MNPRVLIAGGGIGGLAAALACARLGCSVSIFEKTEKLEAIGAGIQLGPNVTRILRAWGLEEALRAHAAYPDGLCVRDATSGALLGQLQLGAAAIQRYGAAYATIHRGDLQALLLEAVRPYTQVGIQLGAAVTSFTQTSESVSVCLGVTGAADSTPASESGDVLLGADGLWSQVRSQLLNDGPPQATGHVAYRALVDQKSLPHALRTNHITAWLGPNMHVVHYPVRAGQWLNVVVILEGQDLPQAHGWGHVVSREDVLRGVLQGVQLGHNLPSALLSVLDAAKQWQAWQLHTRPPMQSANEHAPQFCAAGAPNRRVALLGDAAHPMLPYLAQGAGMAIEDAQALAQSLAKPNADLPTQLQQFASARWQRNVRVQSRALRNAKIFHASGLVRFGRNLSMKLLGEWLLDVPWLYGAENGRS